MKATFYTSIFFAAAFILISCGGEEPNQNLVQLQAKRDSLKTAQATISEQLKEVEIQIAQLDTANANKGVLVTTENISYQPFSHYFEVYGVVASDKNASVTAEMGGTVRSISVVEGQEVSAGQTLISLDTEVLRKNIKEIETSLQLATTMYDKQKKLWDQKIGSEIQYLQAENQMEALEARLSSAQSQLSKAVITAPFSGVVDEIFVKSGEMVIPQFPAVRLVNVSKVHIVADVSEEYITHIKVGDSAQVKFGSLNNNWSSAKISQVGSFINPNNRTFKVKFELENQQEEAQLKPNLLTAIKVKDYETDSALVVPAGIVQQDANAQSFVYLADFSSAESLAKKCPVTVGRSYKGKTEILAGLKEKDAIIMEGARSVNNGEAIQVKE